MDLHVEKVREEILGTLISFNFREIKITNEEDIEKELVLRLKGKLKPLKKRVRRQDRNIKERILIPDITIGLNEFLIEIKYLKSVDDLYRCFYQAVKYKKIVHYELIFFIFDPNFIMTEEDKKDLASLPMVHVVTRR